MIDSTNKKIKWSYTTRTVSGRPDSLGQAADALRLGGGPPTANDVIVAEVLEIGRHTRIEYGNGTKSQLFLGDLIGVAFGHRYATRQWRGRIPETIDTCHLLSVGGVCGEVVDMSPEMDPPTILRPLGYLLNGDPKRVNLTNYGIKTRTLPPHRPTVILVVGSSMDSGKTTAVYSTVNGISKSGARVCAAKLTGTACAKDLLLMQDAGADRVLDFTDVGHASTAECNTDELRSIATAIIAQLAEEQPDFLVLEIADGVVQRETDMLLRELHTLGCIDYTIYTCNDTLGVREGVRILRDIGLNVVAISGMVACSPLAAQEAQAVSDLPVLQPADLVEPQVIQLFSHADGVARSNASTQPQAVPATATNPGTARTARAG